MPLDSEYVAELFSDVAFAVDPQVRYPSTNCIQVKHVDDESKNSVI